MSVTGVQAEENGRKDCYQDENFLGAAYSILALVHDFFRAPSPSFFHHLLSVSTET